jgi:hypothetical protein
VRGESWKKDAAIVFIGHLANGMRQKVCIFSQSLVMIVTIITAIGSVTVTNEQKVEKLFLLLKMSDEIMTAYNYRKPTGSHCRDCGGHYYEFYDNRQTRFLICECCGNNTIEDAEFHEQLKTSRDYPEHCAGTFCHKYESCNPIGKSISGEQVTYNDHYKVWRGSRDGYSFPGHATTKEEFQQWIESQLGITCHEEAENANLQRALELAAKEQIDCPRCDPKHEDVAIKACECERPENCGRDGTIITEEMHETCWARFWKYKAENLLL